MDIKKCKIKVIIDSREKSIKHIIKSFEGGFEENPSHHDMYVGKKSKVSEPIQYYVQEKGLKVGDYTLDIKLPNSEIVNMQNVVVVERKADLNELCCNLFDKKDDEGLTRFERELKRAYEQNIKVHLLVETNDMHSKILSSKHFRYDRASKVTPKTFNSILHSLCARYNITVWYCDKKDSARLIYDILYYKAREVLKECAC